VRAGRRLAAALHADWIVAYVETPRLQRLPEQARDAILEDLRLAESLGAMTVTLSGPQMSTEILEYARRQNVTRIVLGKPSRTGPMRWLLGSVVDTVVRHTDDIDVYLLGPGAEDRAAGAAAPLIARSRAHLGVAPAASAAARPRPGAYLWSLGVVAACTAVASTMSGMFELVNLAMVYLLGVVVVAALYGRGPSVLASVLGVAAFDFFFVPPRFSLAVADTEYLLTFAVMLLVALLISSLTAGMRRQARVARHRETRMSALYALSRELAAARGEDEIVHIAVRHLAEVFTSQAVILLPDATGRIVHPRAESIHGSLHGADLAVAQWVHDRGRPAGRGTDTLPAAEAHYLPLSGVGGAIGVLALLPAFPLRLFVPEQHRLLETFASQVVLALERVRLAAQAQAGEVKIASERLRNSLLSAISHDLRTPLAVIVGGLESLARDGERMSPESRRELRDAISEEAIRMTGLVDNVLDMARLEAGAIEPRRQWHSLEELVGSVLRRLAKRLAAHPVETALDADLPLVMVDGMLIEQVLVNLLDNAVRYTPPGTRIRIAAGATAGEVTVSVADEGPGLPAGEEQQVFDKFYRARPESAQGGFGLGLTICRAIVEAHGGRIHAGNGAGAGAVFRFTLPRETEPPAVEPEPAAQGVEAAT